MRRRKVSRISKARFGLVTAVLVDVAGLLFAIGDVPEDSWARYLVVADGRLILVLIDESAVQRAVDDLLVPLFLRHAFVVGAIVSGLFRE